MNNLNLKHLRYFWAVVSNGSISRAAEALHVTPQTISGQLRQLEHQLDTRLFQKAGRGLALTDTGRLVYDYAEEIFRLGNELQDLLRGHDPASPLNLKVGIALMVPKLLAYRILEPALNLEKPVRLVCSQAPLLDLLAELAVHKLDLVLADSPVGPGLNLRAYNHSLGESGISFFARESEAKHYREQFPHSLDGSPMLMPTALSNLRRSLDLWFERIGIKPLVVAEFDDRALMKVFGEAAAGVFTSPTAVEKDVLSKYSVQVIGRSTEISEHFYAISSERKIRHPAISAITEAARTDLFSQSL